VLKVIIVSPGEKIVVLEATKGEGGGGGKERETETNDVIFRRGGEVFIEEPKRLFCKIQHRRAGFGGGGGELFFTTTQFLKGEEKDPANWFRRPGREGAWRISQRKVCKR